MRAIRLVPAVVLAAVLAAVGLTVLLPDEAPLPGVSASPRESSTPIASPSGSVVPTATPTAGAPIQAASYRGPAYDLNTLVTPTEWTSQSKTWFNDGSWWALMAAGTTGRIHIHELNWESQHWVDTGVLVDERPFARHEALWDGESLHVAGSGSRNSSSHALRYARFTYDTDARRYVLQPDFPRILASGGVGAVSLARGPDGRIWMVTVEARRPIVRSSDDDGATWSAPLDLAATVGAAQVERAAVTATPSGVAVAWTSLSGNELHVAQHAEGAADDDWDAASVGVDGLVYGDDDLSLRASGDGSVIAAVRTSLDRVENRNLDAPQIMVLRLHDGEWTESVAARVRDRLTGPHIVVDDEHDSLLLFAEAEDGIRVKRADLETLRFPAGEGALAIRPETLPEPTATPVPTASAQPTESASPRVPRLGEVTTTKQPLTGLTEVVVVASDDITGHYAHAVVALPAGRTGPDAEGHAAPLPDDIAPGIPPGATTFLMRDSFTPYPAGPASVSGWTTRDEPVDELATISEPSEGDPALRLLPDATGSGARACKAVPETSGGLITIGVTAQTRGTLDSDATILHVRTPDGFAVTVRFGEPGTFRYFVGDERVTSEVPHSAATWYRSVVTLDFASQTYAWSVTPLGAGAPILAVDSLPLRVPATSVTEICVESGNELPGGSVELLVDDVTVEVGPSG